MTTCIASAITFLDLLDQNTLEENSYKNWLRQLKESLRNSLKYFRKRFVLSLEENCLTEYFHEYIKFISKQVK